MAQENNYTDTEDTTTINSNAEAEEFSKYQITNFTSVSDLESKFKKTELAEFVLYKEEKINELKSQIAYIREDLFAEIRQYFAEFSEIQQYFAEHLISQFQSQAKSTPYFGEFKKLLSVYKDFIGSCLADNNELRAKTNDLQDSEYQKQILELQNNYLSVLQNKESEIARLNAELAKKTGVIADLSQDNTNYLKEIYQLKTEASIFSAETANLKSEIALLLKRNSESNFKISQLEAILAKLERKTDFQNQSKNNPVVSAIADITENTNDVSNTDSAISATTNNHTATANNNTESTDSIKGESIDSTKGVNTDLGTEELLELFNLNYKNKSNLHFAPQIRPELYFQPEVSNIQPKVSEITSLPEEEVGEKRKEVGEREEVEKNGK